MSRRPVPETASTAASGDDEDKAPIIKKIKVVPQQVKHDENAFALGVFNVVFSAWLIGSAPHCYWIWHAIKTSGLLVARFFSFTKKKWGFFLLEFCYTVNYWTFLYFCICMLKANFPALDPFKGSLDVFGPYLFRCAFTWCIGPLALSVIFFRNSLVFHSQDQLAIFAVHFSPNLAVYGMRWFVPRLEETFPNTFHLGCTISPPPPLYNSNNESNNLSASLAAFFTKSASPSCPATLFQLLLVPWLGYIVLWTIPYTLFFFFFGKEYMERNHYENMWTTMKDNAMVKKATNLASEPYKPIAYMLLHLSLCSISFLSAPLLWNSYLLHTLYLCVVFAVGTMNGGSYYFEVFANRYANDVLAKSAAATSTTTAVKNDN